MPARVMRAEILSSESLSQVSIEADLVFRSLILIADDYGRIDGRPALLRAAMFPLRPSVTVAKLERWLDELIDLDDPPLRRYWVKGRPYLALSGWETYRGKSRRAASSKFPEEPENEINASPEIREISGDPPVGMEARVRGMEAREIPADLPATPVSRAPRKVPKPDRFEGEHRERIIEWAGRKGYSPRVIAEGHDLWEAWGPAKDFMRPMSSWEGSFKRIVREAVEAGKIKRETEAERIDREAAVFRSGLKVVGGDDE